MNKQGKTSPMVFVFGLIVVLLLGFFAYNSFAQKTIGGDLTNPSVCADSTGVLTLTANDALQKGTTISSPTITCGVNGGAVLTSVSSGTTTFPIGASLDCIVSKTGYIDVEYKNVMSCGGLQESVELYQSTADNPSITIKDLDTSTSALTDNIAGGSVNVSSLSPGDSKTLEVKFKGTALESSGDGIFVIEFPSNSNANITSGNTGVTLGNLAHVSVPTVHTSQNAGSRIDAFEVPAVVGSVTATYDLTFSLQSGKDLSGGVYTDWYNKQAFVDTDGTIKVDVENSLGTAKYENTLDYDFYINA